MILNHEPTSFYKSYRLIRIFEPMTNCIFSWTLLLFYMVKGTHITLAVPHYPFLFVLYASLPLPPHRLKCRRRSVTHNNTGPCLPSRLANSLSICSGSRQSGCELRVKLPRDLPRHRTEMEIEGEEGRERGGVSRHEVALCGTPSGVCTKLMVMWQVVSIFGRMGELKI